MNIPDRAAGLVVSFKSSNQSTQKDIEGFSETIRLLDGVIRIEQIKKGQSFLVIFGQSMGTGENEWGSMLKRAVERLARVASVEWVEQTCDIGSGHEAGSECDRVLTDLIKELEAPVALSEYPTSWEVNKLRARELAARRLRAAKHDLSWGGKD